MRIGLFWISLHVASAVASKTAPQSQRQKELQTSYWGCLPCCFFPKTAPEVAQKIKSAGGFSLGQLFFF